MGAGAVEPIYLTRMQMLILADAVILDPDPPWREQVGHITGRHTAPVEWVEDSTPYLEGWLSDEEIVLAIGERHPVPWLTEGRLIFDGAGRVVVGETCGAPSVLVARWIAAQFNEQYLAITPPRATFMVSGEVARHYPKG